MSCNSCNKQKCNGSCYEARLSLGLDVKKENIVGSIDGVYIKPISIKSVVKQWESNTNLKYDPSIRSLVFQNEASRNGTGNPDFVTTRDLLSGADISEIGNIGSLVAGGLASVSNDNGNLQLQFSVPIPVGVSETSTGFITYVPNPVDGIYYKRIQPDTGGTSDTVLVGHPDGTVEFASPIASPVLVPTANLTSGGAFSGTPSTSSGTWRYQQMGQSQVITNTSGSRIEVELSLSWSLQTAGSRSGFYAELINGGSDYKTTFVQGQSNIKREGYPGGSSSWKVVLDANQRVQFRFGAWTNATGTMVATIGSVNETAGTTVQTVYQPVITLRRLI